MTQPHHEFVSALTFENELEASILLEVLETRNIPFQLKTYQDSAYGNLFKNQKGWGTLWLKPEHIAEVEGIYTEINRPQS